jgi:hypothetical protein
MFSGHGDCQSLFFVGLRVFESWAFGPVAMQTLDKSE